MGKSLNDLIRRILSRSTVDRDAVEALIKGLQRILLQTDVDVKLVFELSENIRNKCFKEKLPPGLTLREHVMKVVYDELVKLLGEEQVSLVGKKKIMLVGLFGSGKCVHGDSLIPLSTGEITTIKDLYEKLTKNNKEIEEDDGFKINIKDDNIKIYSLNCDTGKIEQKEVQYAWKLRSTPKMMLVALDNGNNHVVKVTPEHPFFVLNNNEITKIPAELLEPSLQVAIPRILPFKNEGDVSLRRIFLEQADDNWKILDKRFASQVRTKLIQKYKTLEIAYNELKLNIPYSRFTRILKHGEFFPISLYRKTKDMGIDVELSNNIKIKISGTQKAIDIPNKLNAPLAELMGYIFGDGYISDKYVEFINSNFKLIVKFDQLLKQIFDVEGKIIQDKRRKGLRRVQIASLSLVKYLQTISDLPTGAKSRKLDFPELLLKSSDFVIKFFLRAYFDCDSYVNKDGRNIEFVLSSNIASKKLQMILTRLGIVSTLSKRRVSGRDYFRLMINAKYAEKFAKDILSYSEKNIQKLLDFEKIGERQGAGKQDMIEVGNTLKRVREGLGLTINQIQRHVSSYGIYEKNGRISRQSLKMSVKVMEENAKNDLNWIIVLSKVKTTPDYYKLRNDLSTNKEWLNAILGRLRQQGFVRRYSNPHLTYEITEKGIVKLEKTKNTTPMEGLKFLKKLAKSDVCWIKVKSIDVVEPDSQFVYDLTVDGTHNFVANNIVVHNTTTAGKIARYFQKQGLKPAMICSDYHRPAAPQQLQQLGDKLHVPVHVSKEKDSFKALKEGLGQFNKYDTIIIDTAGRDALDKELAKELKKMYEMCRPDEVLLVIPADIGRIAGKQAEEFHKLVGVTGVIVTKIDGTAKGGGALSACSMTQAKVKFIGTGEKLEDLETYDPVRFVSRLLGMGDLQSLLEKAKEASFEEKDVEKMLSGKFTLGDFYDQISGMQKMGPLDEVMKMIPGLGYAIPEDLLQVQEEKLRKYKYIIDSMTKKERESPEIIHASQIKRISKGAGVSEKDVRGLLKQFNQTKKVIKKIGGMKGLKRGKMKRIARKLGIKLT